jgi:hypothetical protein
VSPSPGECECANALRASAAKRTSGTGCPSGGPVAANVRDLSSEAAAPDCKYIADFAYVQTAGGSVYIAAVINFSSSPGG